MGQFHLVNPGLQDWIGGFTPSTADTLKTGLLARISANGVLTVCTADNDPDGFVFTNRTQVYARADGYADAGEYVTLVRGRNVRALVDSSFFYTNTLPARNALLYTAGNGLMDTSGAAAGYVGKCIDSSPNVRSAPNTESNMVEIEATFGV